MGVQIKREKSGVTHWAAAVNPAGWVTRWTAKRSEAAAVAEELAGKVRANLAGQANAGAISFVPPAADAAVFPPVGDPALVARLEAAAAEVERLKGELADAKAEIALLTEAGDGKK